jgi:hypothetical protein
MRRIMALIPAMIAMVARLISTERKRYLRNEKSGVVLVFSACSVTMAVGLPAPDT